MVEVVPFPLFLRQNEAVRSLLLYFGAQVPDKSGVELQKLHADLAELSDSSACRVCTVELAEMAAKRAAATAMAHSGVSALPGTGEPGRPGPAATASSGGAGFYIRVEDIKSDLDTLLETMKEMRSDLDSVRVTVGTQGTTSQTHGNELSWLRGEVRESHVAVVAQDQQITSLSKQLQKLEEDLAKSDRRMDMEAEAWKRSQGQEVEQLRRLISGVGEEATRGAMEVRDVASKELAGAVQEVRAWSESKSQEYVGISERRIHERLQLLDERTQQWHTKTAQGLEGVEESLGRQGEKLKARIDELHRWADESVSMCKVQLDEERAMQGARLSEAVARVDGMIKQCELEQQMQQRTVRQTIAEVTAMFEREKEDTRRNSVMKVEEKNNEVASRLEQLEKASQQQARDAQAEAVAWAKRYAEEVRHELKGNWEKLKGFLLHQDEKVMTQADQNLQAAIADTMLKFREEVGETRRWAEEVLMAGRVKELRQALSEGLSAEHQHADAVGNKLLSDVEAAVAAVKQAQTQADGAYEVKLTEHRRLLADQMERLDHKVEGAYENHARDFVGMKEDFLLLRRDFGVANEARHVDQAKLKAEVASLLDALQTEAGSTVQRISQESEKAEQMVRSLAEEVHGSMKSLSEAAREECERVRTVVQEEVAEVHRRWGRHTEMAVATLGELRATADQDRLESRARGERAEEMIRSLDQVAASAKAESVEAKRVSSLAESTIKTALVTLQDVELRALGEQIRTLQAGGNTLASGVLRMAQAIGILPGIAADPDTGTESSPVADWPWKDGVDLLELLDWERAGNSLARRIDNAWLPRCSATCHTILDQLCRKAEHSTMKLLQTACRDLDVRMTQLKSEREAWREFGVTVRWLPDIKPGSWMRESPAPGIPRPWSSEAETATGGERSREASAMTTPAPAMVQQGRLSRAGGAASVEPFASARDGSAPPGQRSQRPQTCDPIVAPLPNVPPRVDPDMAGPGLSNPSPLYRRLGPGAAGCR